MSELTTTCPQCGHKHPSKAENGRLIPRCPACGRHYFRGEPLIETSRSTLSQPSQPSSQPKPTPHIPTETEKLLAYQELASHKTNHILHLLLSIFTMGIWLIPWFIASANNTSERNKIRQKYHLPIESNGASLLVKCGLALFLIVIFFKGCSNG